MRDFFLHKFAITSPKIGKIPDLLPKYEFSLRIIFLKCAIFFVQIRYYFAENRQHSRLIAKIRIFSADYIVKIRDFFSHKYTIISS